MPPWNNGVSPKYGVTQIYLRASNIRLRAAYADPVATCGYLANITPPALRRRSATDKLLCNIEAHPSWPLYAYVFDHPQKRLVARRPIWADTTPVDQSAQ